MQIAIHVISWDLWGIYIVTFQFTLHEILSHIFNVFLFLTNIPTSPTCILLFQRCAPAAAELNGVLYVIGGYDGNMYLQLRSTLTILSMLYLILILRPSYWMIDPHMHRSAERYDPREGFWTQLPRMRTRRGSHSVVVLGDSLWVSLALSVCVINREVMWFQKNTHTDSTWQLDATISLISLSFIWRLDINLIIYDLTSNMGISFSDMLWVAWIEIPRFPA